MFAPSAWRFRRGLAATALVAAAAMIFGASTKSAAGEAAKPPVSLQVVPDDVAIYSAMLRNREVFTAIGGSRAWAKFKAMPFVQQAWAMYTIQASMPGGPVNAVETALADPKVREALAFLKEISSDEIFVCADRSAIDFFDLYQRVLGGFRYGPLMLQLGGRVGELAPDKIQAALVLSALAENADKLKVPNLIVGFKVKDVKAAQKQLDELEKQVRALVESQPQWKGRLKKADVGGAQLLTLSLDGGMFSWDEEILEPLRGAEIHKGDLDKVVARLKRATLAIAVGLRGDLLLVSVGSSTDALARLGKGKPLADRPEMAPLAKFAERRLTSVGYISEEFSQRLLGGTADVEQGLKAVDAALRLSKLPSGEQEQIRKDAAALAADLKSLLPHPGATMGLNFLSDRGLEGYQYSWGDHRRLDGSKPLSLLEHVGGNPIFAAMNRAKVSVQDYDLLVKWAKVGYGYVEKYAVPKMSSNDRGEFEKFVALAIPLVKRFDQTTRDMLLPALADGQFAAVLDAKLKSKQFLESKPATEDLMPMAEPALVFGVSNPELLVKACAQYREIFNALVDALRTSSPDANKSLERVRIPEPRVLKRKAGTLYAFDLPKEWGLDKRILPNAGLSANVAVVSITSKHSQRLLTATPATVSGQSLPSEQLLAGAGFLDVAGLIDALTPWVDLGIHAGFEQSGEANNPMATSVLDQVHTVLDIVKVVRSVVVRNSIEGKAQVQHVELEIRDVAE